MTEIISHNKGKKHGGGNAKGMAAAVQHRRLIRVSQTHTWEFCVPIMLYYI